MNDILQVQWKVHDQAIESRVGDETVILHLENGTYFGLDPIGTRIWELLKESKGPSAICDALAEEFDTPLDKVTDDLRALLNELKVNNLLIAS